MCQLFGCSSNFEVDISVSLREFRHRGKENPHGWGFAYHKEKGWELLKEDASLADVNPESNPFNFQSKLIIGHVRLASCGVQSHANTHPFVKFDWAFAHNGTIKEFASRLPLMKFRPKGGTDSEHVFCYLMDRINAVNDFVEILQTLQTEADKIRGMGKFNFLLSNGEYLFAHGDDRLFYTIRHAPFPVIDLVDDKSTVYLKGHKRYNEKAIIIATEPLTTGEEWIRITGLKIFKEGEEIEIPQQ